MPSLIILATLVNGNGYYLLFSLARWCIFCVLCLDLYSIRLFFSSVKKDVLGNIFMTQIV